MALTEVVLTQSYPSAGKSQDSLQTSASMPRYHVMCTDLMVHLGSGFYVYKELYDKLYAQRLVLQQAR